MKTPNELVLLVAVGVLSAGTACDCRAAGGVDLPIALSRLADETLAACRDGSHANVGVLKFLAFKKAADQLATPADMADTIGVIHSLMARRLEVALILANDSSAPIGVIDDASAIASEIDGADFFTRAGRAKLFQRSYPLHWGDRQVTPDLFVTGLVRIDPRLTTATISLFRFSRKDLDLSPLGDDLVVKIGAELLPEIGESFSLSRGAFTGGTFKGGADAPSDLPDDIDEASAGAAVDTRKGADKHPAVDPDAPVRVRLLYDGRQVEPSIEDGVARVSEPRSGQRIELEIVKDSTPDRYAVCVKVNGESTYRRSTVPDANCRKYLLLTPGQVVRIEGYQIDDNRIERFEVLATDASAEREFDYGKQVGLISVTAFPEASSVSGVASPGGKALDAIAAARLPTEKAASHARTKLAIMGYANRGLIVQGATKGSQVVLQKFAAEKKPAMSLTLRYYDPAD